MTAPSPPPLPASPQRPALLGLSPQALGELAESVGLPRRTGPQVLHWLWQRGEADPGRMSDLSKAARAWLAESCALLEGDLVAEQAASDGTRKLLLGWPGSVAGASERRTECVMIPTPQRRTACVSSQVGCPVGCRFCASGLGFEGNLTAARIAEQVWRLSRLEGVGRISHLVFMGMGEPLANIAAVTEAIRILNAPWGGGISARRITVSTVGLPAAIRRFAEFELPVNLALSLHAPNDDLRRRIIPWSEHATIAEILDACAEWFARSGREITLEYLLLGGFNDSPEHAKELSSLAKRLRSSVNLIRYNEVKGLPFDRPATDAVRRFQEILRERGVNSHIRASRGRDIAAACGQLRHEHSGTVPLTLPADPAGRA